MRQLYLVSYDIVDNTRRARVLRTIKGNAVGGQKSVYECWLDKQELQAVNHRIDMELVHERDRVMLIRLDQRAAIHVLGVGVAPADGDVFYQG